LSIEITALVPNSGRIISPVLDVSWMRCAVRRQAAYRMRPAAVLGPVAM
jgi:hypothetical protein